MSDDGANVAAPASADPRAGSTVTDANGRQHDGGVEHLLREAAPQVLGAVLRRYPDFDTAEDAVQEALLAATVQWPVDGVPSSPHGWLVTVATRRLADWHRRESTRRLKEATAAALVPDDQRYAPPPDADDPAGSAAGHGIEWPVESAAEDNTLELLYLCCHPALSRAAQVALTLRAVGGLTTTEIAGAFLVPEPTMAQRIVRAKHRIRAAGIPFPMPAAVDRDDRLAAVLQVLYLIFNEGYAAQSGSQLLRADLTAEAIRLTRRLHRRLPEHGEVAGLLALMLLTDARREARTDPNGGLVPLAEQDRSRWNADQLRQGTELVAAALAGWPLGPYQVEAAIAAVHAGASRVEDTDWRQILALYGILQRLVPSPLVTLNQAVAAAMVHGPAAGLELLRSVEADPRLVGHHRLAAVRAHLLEMAGDAEAARACYRQAAQSTRSVPERHYLLTRANRIRAAESNEGGQGPRGEPPTAKKDATSHSFAAESTL